MDRSPKCVNDKSLSKNSLSKGKGSVQRRGSIVELEEKSAKAADSERVLKKIDVNSRPDLQKALFSSNNVQKVGSPDFEKLDAIDHCLREKAGGINEQEAKSRLRKYFSFFFPVIFIILFISVFFFPFTFLLFLTIFLYLK